MAVHIMAVHLMDVYLRNVHLIDLHLRNVHLIGILLAFLTGVNFASVNPIGVYLTRCAPYRHASHGRASLTDMYLAGVRLIGMS